MFLEPRDTLDFVSWHMEVYTFEFYKGVKWFFLTPRQTGFSVGRHTQIYTFTYLLKPYLATYLRPRYRPHTTDHITDVFGRSEIRSGTA